MLQERPILLPRSDTTHDRLEVCTCQVVCLVPVVCWSFDEVVSRCVVALAWSRLRPYSSHPTHRLRQPCCP